MLDPLPSDIVPSKRPRWLIPALVALLVVGISFACRILTWRDSNDAIVQQAQQWLSKGRPQEALRLLEPLIQNRHSASDAHYYAGLAYSKLNQFDAANKQFLQVSSQDVNRADACFRAADIFLLRKSQLTAAETLLCETLKLQPTHHRAQSHLAALYGLCGLSGLTAPIRLKRLQESQFEEVDLVLLALADTAAENALSLDDYQRAAPTDPLTMVARGNRAWQQFDLPQARIWYASALKERPDLADAQARLGRILMELSDEDAFLEWHRQLSNSVETNAELWAVRGDWSLRVRDLHGAVRCYWEAAIRDATHRRAHFQLGQILAELGSTEVAAAFQHRNESLQHLLLAAKRYTTDASAAAALQLVAAASNCGQSWEAWGWAEVIRRRYSREAAEVQAIHRPDPQTPRVAASAEPARSLDGAAYERPAWLRESSVTHPRRIKRPVPSGQVPIQFSDDAERVGLRFQYVHGDDIPGPGMRMFQFSGGGVGVLDFDRDGWPDLYFTQGGLWPLPDEAPAKDQLFRNVFGQRFEDITEKAGLFETDYSQGLAIGDFDNDGFSDVFVANVQGNRLFQNCGDGTFKDVTDQAGVRDEAWSTSVVCADFNQDGLPDLFVTNYLQGPGLLDRICRQANGTPRACTPHEFDAADDQLLLNLGDGRFQDVTAEAGILAPGGKGLGVLAADFEGEGRISLFVGNDTTANFFFHNQSIVAGSMPKFVESAVIHGLAFDAEGRPQACMGIAAEDANGDHKLDLFVTNYYLESNTLYQQQSNLLFADVTSQSGLREPSLKQLGFGTQFLDADLDGWPDLVVTNGHVDDETARGIPLQMPTQLFRNLGAGHFVEVPATELGPWFEGQYLGRGLARVDWNRDGREDFVVSLLDKPAALLTNQSVTSRRYLGLQLVGTNSSRDAIGTTVQVKTDARTLVKQLVAGDGYQASNERQLVFGVDQCDRTDVTILWPSGQRQSFPSVLTNGTWLAIEGRTDLLKVNSGLER